MALQMTNFGEFAVDEPPVYRIENITVLRGTTWSVDDAPNHAGVDAGGVALLFHRGDHAERADQPGYFTRGGEFA